MEGRFKLEGLNPGGSCQFCARSISSLDNGCGQPDTRRTEAVE
jgi:hypothetical protein